ncbi:hypothetical protein [Jannaschia formosa]|uniref:hypothetical protein n=1 Tax=Jannaschia formosa TaxID=2259592 RepID=UPI001074A5DA|nr:hypothetical protein [Jannaschia formosa]TFL19836.1 hypothetical protein DR046_00370 [Jannaschia formosa]
MTYGTFSCTLEGFEDPFTAMTEIAEYFRDLAAKDRYFGAEPPTPDMERLEQIAAASMHGPVSADNSSGRLVLRPSEAEPDLLAAVEDKIAEEKLAQHQEVEDQDDDLDAAADDPFADDASVDDLAEAQHADDPFEDDMSLDDLADAQAAEDAQEAESASSKLARLRDVADEAPADAGFDLDDDSFDPADDAAQDDDVADDHAASPELDDLSGAADSDDDTEIEDLKVEVATPEDAAEDMPFEAHADYADADDADLAEAATLDDDPEMAVEPDADVTVDEDPLEDTPVEEYPVEAGADDEVPADDMLDAVDADMPEPAADTIEVPAEDVVADDDAVAAEDDTMAQGDDARADLVAEDGTTDEKDALAGPDAEAARRSAEDDSLTADLAAMFSPRPGEEPEAPIAQQPEARVTIRKVRKRKPVEAEAIAAAPDAERDEDADLMAELAAIEEELARDATGATAPETAVEDYDDAEDYEDGDDDLEAPARADLHPEAGSDDPDLLSELAAIEAEAGPRTAAMDDAPEEIEDAEPTEADPNDLERLFAATDSRLSGEDTSRRHANISHLKAAVAARRADDTIETEKTDASGAYRKDLANTVRPRRKPAEGDPAADGSRQDRGAPLVLISEQRVEPAPEPEQEVEAAAAPETDIAEGLSKGLRAPDTGDDFEQFAIDVGAVDLADVLEAAAVYSATVMGQESFSRPRLLHLAAEAVDDLSREDGLRGFGQLLRDGTIRKVGRGTFTLGTESRFQTKATRRAG